MRSMLRAMHVLALLTTAVTTVSAQPVFRSGVDLVRFGVTVVDDDGNPVASLTRDNFVVTEEGREQDIAFFARGIAGDLETMPLHLGVLFDSSASMNADADFAKTAAIRFLRRLDFATDTTLVGFDEQVRVSRFLQVDFPRLVERLRSQETAGMTALYDALGVYLDGAFSQDGHKILLLYTDGGDTRSRIRFNELLDLVRASDVTAYVVGFQGQRRTARRMRERLQLEEIAGLTGGQAYFPGSVDELDEIYAQIRDELENRYSLGYVSTDPTRDGAWRRVTITPQDTPDNPDRLEIRTREGYFAPYIEPGSEPSRQW
ncbi:MAG: VWA domain-containing protein [Acidobacteriota bacterium]|nr:VWA domain-containing protein [Acidobacteriota bacterium]